MRKIAKEHKYSIHPTLRENPKNAFYFNRNKISRAIYHN